MRIRFLASQGLFWICGCAAFGTSAPGALTPAWVEVGPAGRALARIVVARGATCPSLTIDGARTRPMVLRTPVPEHLQPACEVEIPRDAKRAAVGSQKLALPVNDPTTVLVLGDTGCRLKDERIQSCNDPREWPFATMAAEAAKTKPKLVVHVGDYLYRETPCPADATTRCGGSPIGDNWESWKADFFTPAAPLLAAAPWAFSRGNHESCARSWQGWFYYLDPRPYQPTCEDYSELYLVTLGKLQLLMTDTSAAKDNATDQRQVARYAAAWKPYAGTSTWLVEHHPVFALKRDKEGKPNLALTSVLQTAFEQAGLKNVSLILAGHTHLFELLGFANGRPVQIVAGDGGTALAEKIGDNLKGETVFGATVTAGASRQQFGFTVLQRRGGNGWSVRLRGLGLKTLATCQIEGASTHCKGQ